MFQGWHRPEGELLWLPLFPPASYGEIWERLIRVGKAGEYVVLRVGCDPNHPNRRRKP